MKRSAPAKVRAPRALVNDLLAELCKRLEKQTRTAEMVAAAAVPNEATTLFGNLPMMTVIALAAGAHAADLRELLRHANLTRDAAARKGGAK